MFLTKQTINTLQRVSTEVSNEFVNFMNKVTADAIHGMTLNVQSNVSEQFSKISKFIFGIKKEFVTLNYLKSL